ncbi:NUDIX domain-containing protein [Lentzea sp. NBRC 102530]|uniref:NUDIX hydrolase n=1 Tax=Lentzea sp. NBRC 102530 TaxID=3032201 RepID=UPI0024A1FD71|nr:NUDIX domain-containing protein [Lentzea sp. NBRC 102530]GLY52717.1 NUDIX hydrolase [Lentzea sp. NBRC 102530]
MTVDLVVLTVRGDELCALLVRRGEAPYPGEWALPGGFVLADESLDAAAARELVEETGVAGLHLEQLGTYGEPGRDPRMRVVSVAYLALAPDLPVPVAGTDAAAASWEPVSSVSSLAFDHGRILADGVERARAKLEYTGLGAEFCGTEFTVAELRRVYEIVWGSPLDPRNFHRKVTGVEGFLVPTGESTSRDGGRPAALYRRGAARVLHPPLARAAGPSAG